jgi:hypothetical protein
MRFFIIQKPNSNLSMRALSADVGRNRGRPVVTWDAVADSAIHFSIESVAAGVAAWVGGEVKPIDVP